MKGANEQRTWDSSNFPSQLDSTAFLPPEPKWSPFSPPSTFTPSPSAPPFLSSSPPSMHFHKQPLRLRPPQLRSAGGREGGSRAGARSDGWISWYSDLAPFAPLAPPSRQSVTISPLSSLPSHFVGAAPPHGSIELGNGRRTADDGDGVSGVGRRSRSFVGLGAN